MTDTQRDVVDVLTEDHREFDRIFTELEGPAYEVEVKSGVGVVRAGSGGSAGVPAELFLVAVRCCGRCPASVSGPT